MGTCVNQRRRSTFRLSPADPEPPLTQTVGPTQAAPAPPDPMTRGSRTRKQTAAREESPPTGTSSVSRPQPGARPEATVGGPPTGTPTAQRLQPGAVPEELVEGPPSGTSTAQRLQPGAAPKAGGERPPSGTSPAQMKLQPGAAPRAPPRPRADAVSRVGGKALPRRPRKGDASSRVGGEALPHRPLKGEASSRVGGEALPHRPLKGEANSRVGGKALPDRFASVRSTSGPLCVIISDSDSDPDNRTPPPSTVKTQTRVTSAWSPQEDPLSPSLPEVLVTYIEEDPLALHQDESEPSPTHHTNNSPEPLFPVQCALSPPVSLTTLPSASPNGPKLPTFSAEGVMLYPSKRYNCPLCPLSVSRRTDALTHYRAHHGPIIPKFRCAKCHKTYKSVRTLKQYCKHGLRTPYACPTCGLRYTTEDRRRQHQIKFHPDLFKPSESVHVITNPRPHLFSPRLQLRENSPNLFHTPDCETAPIEFPCTECSFITPDFVDYHDHIRNYHPHTYRTPPAQVPKRATSTPDPPTTIVNKHQAKTPSPTSSSPTSKAPSAIPPPNQEPDSEPTMTFQNTPTQEPTGPKDQPTPPVSPTSPLKCPLCPHIALSTCDLNIHVTVYHPQTPKPDPPPTNEPTATPLKPRHSNPIPQTPSPPPRRRRLYVDHTSPLNPNAPDFSPTPHPRTLPQKSSRQPPNPHQRPPIPALMDLVIPETPQIQAWLHNQFGSPPLFQTRHTPPHITTQRPTTPIQPMPPVPPITPSKKRRSRKRRRMRKTQHRPDHLDPTQLQEPPPNQRRRKPRNRKRRRSERNRPYTPPSEKGRNTQQDPHTTQRPQRSRQQKPPPVESPQYPDSLPELMSLLISKLSPPTQRCHQNNQPPPMCVIFLPLVC